MKLKNIKEVNDFLSTVDSCGGDVWLESQYGDKFNLKSKFSQYVALAALLGESGDDLMLFCASQEDEAKFFKFFSEHPELM